MTTDLYLSKEVNKRLSSSLEEIVSCFLHSYLASYLIFSLLTKEAGFEKKTTLSTLSTPSSSPMPQDL